MTARTISSIRRIDRRLAAILVVVALIAVTGLLARVTLADTPPAPDPPAAVVASPTDAAPSPTAAPPRGPFIPAQSEVGVAAVEPRLSPANARRASGPVLVDTSQFPPPPPRAGTPPPNGAGIARMVATELSIDHYVEVVGIENNQMQTPEDASYAIGWYDAYARPGSGGNVVVSAHETWSHMQGPFFGLHRAAPGDEIAIEMTDGRRYRYAVFSNVRYPIDDIPMAEIIWPTTRPPGEEWLTLITCGGRIVYDASGFGEYVDRDVVIARRVG